MENDYQIMIIYGIAYLISFLTIIFDIIFLKIKGIKTDISDDEIFVLIIIFMIPFINAITFTLFLIFNLFDNCKISKKQYMEEKIEEKIDYKKEFEDLKTILIAQNIITSEQLEDLIDSIKISEKLSSS